MGKLLVADFNAIIANGKLCRAFKRSKITAVAEN